MPVVGTGELSIPLENLRALLAHSAAFRTWVGAADAAAAKDRIHLVDLPPPEDGREFTLEELRGLRPLAQIDLWTPERGWGEQPWMTQRVADCTYADGGKLTLDLVQDILEEDAANFADCKLRFMNEVGAVLRDIKQMANQTDHLDAGEIAAGIGGIGIHRIEVFQGPARADEAQVQTQGDHWRVQLLVHWGL